MRTANTMMVLAMDMMMRAAIIAGDTPLVSLWFEAAFVVWDMLMKMRVAVVCVAVVEATAAVLEEVGMA